MSAKVEITDTASGPTLQEQFARQGRYTAGVATQYPRGLLTGPDSWQKLATGFPIGARFHSAPAIRLADARPMHLGHVHEADGRWRLYAFADRIDIRQTNSRLRTFCEALAGSDQSLINRFTPAGAEIDAVFDVRGILQQHHTSVDPSDLPPLLFPVKGRFGLFDYEKVFTPAREDVFTTRGIDREAGALVVVRPDQYVAHVLPLDGIDELNQFFSAFML